MIGYKRKLNPTLNISKEPDFILDFLPGIKNEDWKYTNLKKFIPSPIYVSPFKKINNPILVAQVDQFCKSEKMPKKNVVVFLDGVLQKKLSSISTGLKIKQLAINENSGQSLYLNKASLNFKKKERNSCVGFADFLNKTKLIELNSYLTDSPYLLTFDNSFSNKEPLRIVHFFSNQNAFFNQNRLLFLLEKNSNALIHEEIINLGEPNSVFNMVSEFVCLEGSSLDFYVTQNDLTNSSIINSVFCTQEKNSSTNFNTFSLSGKLIRNNVLVELLGEKSSSNVLGTSLLNNSEHLDNFITISHLVENCRSNQLFKSVYGGSSTGSFCGKIFVEKGAQQTEAFQQNNNLMVSKKASVNAKPQLEIFADDVVCSHGCTIGAIDEGALFYLKSRGINEEVALNLLISAFLNDSISNIKNNDIKARLAKLFLKDSHA